MWIDQAKKIKEDFGLTLEHPLFYSRLQAWMDKKLERELEDRHPIQRTILKNLDSLSRRLGRSEMQEGCSARNIYLAKELAMQLVTDDGHLLMDRVEQAIQFLQEDLFLYGPRREYDTCRRKHILRVLLKLRDDSTIVRRLNGISKPYSNPRADRYIRETLDLPSGVAITDGDATRAVLSAWFTYLRQNVGSCFATAPAVVIQSEQPEQFLKDMADLLTSGQLTRRIRGWDCSVPMSESWGAGDLRRPVVVTHDLDACPVKLWLSPGIQLAFEAVGLLDRDLPIKKKVAKVKLLLENAARELEPDHPIFYSSAEQLIRQTVLSQFKITEQDLVDYHSRPRLMIHDGVLVSSGDDGGILGQTCRDFEEALEHAYAGFKGVSDNALLKAWEFTVASFAETKSQLTKWNLYSSLGMDAREKGGIGHRLYEIIKQRLDDANGDMQKQQEAYEAVYSQLKHLEARLRTCRDEKQAKWLKSDYQAKRNESYTYIELRNKAQSRAQMLSSLYDFLIDRYISIIPDYFQEVYDADLHDVATGPYDDSPAGFRLLYKHGRANTSQWTMIHGADGFVESLAAFFVATEHEISTDPFLESLQHDFAYITTSLVTHVKTETFIESAFDRMARAHGVPPVKKPLDNMSQVSKKPWVYTSGGTMDTLVQCYFGGEEPPQDEEIWVETPMELCAFYIDSARKFPEKIIEPYLEDDSRSLLVHSPTHAFLLRPGLSKYRQAIKMPTYSYTWVKENFSVAATKFAQELWLEPDMMQVIFRLLSKEVPKSLHSQFRQLFMDPPAHATVPQFREYVCRQLRSISRLLGPVVCEDLVDSLLYRCIPFTKPGELKERLVQIFGRLQGLGEADRASMKKGIEDLCEPSQALPMPSFQLRNLCLSLLILMKERLAGPVDYHEALIERMRDLKLCLPEPIVFADSNWVTEFFAFVVNPGTGKFELWRVDQHGVVGSPMSHWRKWMDGSQRSPTWGIYTRPRDYQA